jgi:hypothetical protein
MTITLEDLHNDILALHQDFGDLRQDLKLVEVRLGVKIDSKPSLMAMFTGIVVVVFGMFGVVASTIATLHTIGVIK